MTPYRPYDRRHIDRIPQLAGMTAGERRAMAVVSLVMPFRSNAYVIDELIDWRSAPDDPMFRLTFPHRDMLETEDFVLLERMTREGAGELALAEAIRRIQLRLNPHPADQGTLNVPTLEGRRLSGIQHKYPETVLFFPSQGQTCHAYCTYCFRWPQFVGLDDMKFASRETTDLVRYLGAHPEVTSVLVTGGDPLIMRTQVLAQHILPLLDVPSLRTIRIGTKAPAYWPQRFVTDRDADALLALFEQVATRGKQLALMAHYSHPVELSTPIAERALARVRGAGAVVRCQAPIVRHVNDDATTWSTLWSRQVQLGAVPYYMFIERDTGPRGYFEVPLVRAYEVYRQAISQVSGLARTARGPSMSASPGKVSIDGVAEIAGSEVLVLRFLQARDPAWVGRPFFAKMSRTATWLTDLVPATGDEFFYEPGLRALAGPRRLTVHRPEPRGEFPEEAA